MPSTSSALQISIPPNAIVDGDGSLVQEDVNVFVSFSDPRVENGLLGSPGEFTFQDDEGEAMQLQTFGVVGLYAETSDGQEAYVNGEVEFDIDIGSLGIPDPVDGEPDTSLWTLDSFGGNWKGSGSLTGTISRNRKKGQTANVSAAFSGFPPNIPYINIAKPLLRGRQCYVSVFVFKNEDMAVGISGEEVRIYTIEASGRRYLGQSVEMTDLDGKVCLPLTCGLKHELVMHRRYGPAASETHHLLGQFEYLNDPARTRIGFTSPLLENIADGSGPVHRYGMNTCPGSTKQDCHFRFYLTTPMLQEGRREAVELRPNLSLSWYGSPIYDGVEMACVIGINIVVSFLFDIY